MLIYNRLRPWAESSPRCGALFQKLLDIILPPVDTLTVQRGTTNMTKDFYVASKSRPNRPGWSISFRHPLRNDSRGRAGLKMRRGLGTSDEIEAEAMVGEMNTILADQTWWNAARRQEAELRFSKPVVEAFYDEIQAG